MNYRETIDYLFSRLPMFSRIGAAAFKKDLTNTIRLCKHLANPQDNFKTIHIAGTNGKGSVSHMLAAILQSAGYKTGLYTSPHLKDFRERIKLNGELCPEEFVVEFTEKIKPVIEEIEPSFFEITVAMAFEYFAKEKVDIAIIETGLGGRYDSTNIIKPEVSVITNIGWDHMNILGDSLEKIAFEKAGIIKPSTPVVLGEIQDQLQPIFEKIAKENNSQLVNAPDERHAISWEWQKHELVVEVTKNNRTDHQHYHLDLAGIYQVKNILPVLETIDELIKKGWTINDAAIKNGLRNTKKLTGLHGRWEVIHEHPMVVLDVAHNEDGIKMLMEQIEITNYERLHFILGLAKDKEVEKILSLLPRLAVYYFTKAKIPRALDEKILKEKAESYGLTGETYDDVNTAMKIALDNSDKNDLILICGSLFLIAEVNMF